MWLAAHTERVSRLVLACTAPYLPPREQWLDRAATVREQGVGAIADAVVARWFTAAVRRHDGLARAARRDTGRGLRPLLRGDRADGLARGSRADQGSDHGDPRPTTIRSSTTTAGACSRDLGSVVELDAAHLANVEQPAAFNEAVLAA